MTPRRHVCRVCGHCFTDNWPRPDWLPVVCGPCNARERRERKLADWHLGLAASRERRKRA